MYSNYLIEIMETETRIWYIFFLLEKNRYIQKSVCVSVSIPSLSRPHTFKKKNNKVIKSWDHIVSIAYIRPFSWTTRSVSLSQKKLSIFSLLLIKGFNLYSFLLPSLSIDLLFQLNIY